MSTISGTSGGVGIVSTGFTAGLGRSRSLPISFFLKMEEEGGRSHCVALGPSPGERAFLSPSFPALVGLLFAFSSARGGGLYFVPPPPPPSHKPAKKVSPSPEDTGCTKTDCVQ